MPAEHFFAENPREVGLDPAKVEALFERARREIRDGLLPSCQLAIARKGKIAAMASFGRAVQGGVEKPVTNETLYVVYSSTKAIVSAAAWILIGEGRLDPGERVADIIPEFATNDKDKVTVEQVLTHTSGFPNAPYPPVDWLDRKKRLERFAAWRLEFEPGTMFTYHPTSGFWVIAEIIERRSGQDFRQFVRNRIALPLGLHDLWVGLPPEHHHRVADVVNVGQELTAEEREQLNWPEIPTNEVTPEAIVGFNDPLVRESGVPGGGGIMTAGDLALFYQTLLNDGCSAEGKQIWQPHVLREATRVRSGDLVDPIFKFKANRGLGVIIAGDDGFSNYRGLGKTVSARAFGHGGAGGQIAWGDPESGVSLGYCTNGNDLNVWRQGRRGVAISSLAGVCAC